MPCLYLQSPRLQSLAVQPTPHEDLTSHLVVVCAKCLGLPLSQGMFRPESGASQPLALFLSRISRLP